MLEQDAAEPVASRRMWHVVITTAGPSMPPTIVKEALERLSERHQFLLSARYSDSRAEVRYWDESSDVRSVAARAFSLWSDYSELAALPPWEVVGLEVVERDAFHARATEGTATRSGVGLESGGVHPF